MNHWIRLVLRFPKTLIVINLVITLGLGYAIRNLKMNPDVTAALPQHIPAKRLYDKMGEIFPSQEFIFVGLSGDDIFAPENLQTVWQLTKKLETYPAVHSVISPTNVSVIKGTPEGMEVYDILSEPPKAAVDIEHFRYDLFHSDLALGNLVSKDQQAFGIMLFLKSTADVPKFVAQLIKDIDKFRNTTKLKVIITGKPVVSYYVSQGMQRDMGIFFMAGIGIIFLLLLVIFRNFRGIFLPLSVVIFSVIWTMGLLALLKIPMGHALEILPILIMAIAVADSIHILSHFYHHAGEKPGATSAELTEITMQEMSAPVIMTSLTTMAGFIALGTVGATSVATLGIFTALGVLFALVLTLTWFPAFLVLLPVPLRFRKYKARRNGADLMERWGNFLVKEKQLMLPFIILTLLIAVWGFTRLDYGFSSIKGFPEGHPVREAAEWVNEHFAGTTGFAVMVEGRREDVMKDPLLLARLDSLKDLALRQPHVGSVQSLADFIKRINKVLHADDPAFYRIPPESTNVTGTEWVEENGTWKEVEKTYRVSGRELVAQYLQLLEMSGKPGSMENLVDYKYQYGKMNIMLNTDDVAALRRVDHVLSRYLEQHVNNDSVQAAVTGLAKLVTVVDDMIVKGQFYSIITSLFLVWLLTTFMFRSPVVGFFNTLPLFFALVLNFAVMGFTGIKINLETLTTSSIAIGVGVDYAIHFIHRYRMKLKEGHTYESAVGATMRESGLAILYNSIVVAAGFAVIATSAFVPIREMGAMITLTMLTAAFGALTIVPGVFILLKPKSLQIKEV